MLKVLTGGRFNKIHPGHEYLLKKCKKLGYLVVVVANDKHNTGAIKAEMRKRNLEKLGIADDVIIGHPDSFVKTVLEEKPNIIALGHDQKMPEDVTKDVLRKMKIKVVRIKKLGDY